MYKNLVTFFVAVIFFLPTVNAALPDFSDLVEDVSPSVVKINTLSISRQHSSQKIPDIFRDLFEYGGQPRSPEQKVRSSGSGFVISSDGYILTNHHVVDQATEIQVLFSDRSEYQATIIGSDRRSDLALLKIEAKNLDALKFADSDKLKVGEWVLAIGSPFGLDYSATVGIVSAKGRSLPTDQGENYVPFIQTDVAINPGNSGGPLFNLDGRVVGINSQIFSRSGGSIGLSFSIPSSVALRVVEQLKETGVVQRGWLGVAIQDVNKALAQSLELDKPRGALINAVEIDSPADKGGIEPGDVIVSVDGQNIVDADDLPHLVGMLAPDTKTKIEVIRKGKRKLLKVTVGALDGDKDEIAETEDNNSDRLGLSVKSVTEDQLRELRLRGGVLVTEVLPDSPSAVAGIKSGDILVQLGYSRIDDTDEYQQVIADLPNNTPILVRYYRQGWAISKTIVIK
ncbi:MAG: DegQ family serine endoprotease [Porticoccaceae bacterium]